MERPIVGISMGDPFGNGPEITVKALNDPEVYKTCRPLVVGDRSCMEYALAVSRKVNGIDLKLNYLGLFSQHEELNSGGVKLGLKY